MQNDLFSKLKSGSQDGIEFPVLDVSIKTGSAAAIHRFPQRRGAFVERTGADPQSGSMRCAFFTGLYKFPVKDLWPGQLSRLRQKVQEQVSYELVVPTFGTIPKAFVSIVENATSYARDGVQITLEFTEDSVDDFTKPLATIPYGKAEEAAIVADVALTAIGYKAYLEVEDTSASGGVDFATALAAAKFQLQTAQDSLAAPLRQFQLIAERATELLDTVFALGDPGNWECIRALRDLRSAVNDVMYSLAADKQILGYRVQSPMSAAAIAAATGNTVSDILSLNALADANSVDAGEIVQVTKK